MAQTLQLLCRHIVVAWLVWTLLGSDPVVALRYQSVHFLVPLNSSILVIQLKLLEAFVVLVFYVIVLQFLLPFGRVGLLQGREGLLFV